MKKYIEILGKQRYYYGVAALLFMLVIFFRTAEPKIVQIVIDNVIAFYAPSHVQSVPATDGFSIFINSLLPDFHTHGFMTVLLAVGGIYIVFALARCLLLFTAGILISNVTETVLKKLRDRMFKHIQNLPMLFFGSISKGEIIQRATGDVETIRYFLEEHFVEIMRLLALFIFTFLMMGTINWVYAWINIATVPIAIILGIIYYRQSARVWAIHEQEADKLNSIVQENISNMRLVQSFAKSDYEINRFREQSLRKKTQGLRMSVLNTKFSVWIDVVVYTQTIGSIFTGIVMVLQGNITVGELIAMYWLFSLLSWPMRQVNRVLAQMGMANVAVGRIYEILEATSEHKNEISSKTLLKGKIEFRNVSFRYRKTGKQWVLRNVSFVIQPGEKVAITGPTGAGKSTLINLLLRFYEPDEGTILLDDTDIRDIPRKTLRSQIGVAFQRPFLFSASVKDNICYAFPNATDTDVTGVLSLAEINEMLGNLPSGIDSFTGEKGSSLSGGQRQRVALARTLITNPAILVLDDITSALDATTESRLFQRLDNHLSGHTTIIIAHRPVSIKRADKVIFLQHGEVSLFDNYRQFVARISG
ncbi:MAG: ABC transporter ATP-binding protein [Bacteroidota bacterium]|nr:ABC transporter ATP-binding protein [Bacteroidota bacterium]